MMIHTRPILQDFLHLFYPQLCAGCGRDLSKDVILCHHCIADLPHTLFETLSDNPVENIFKGRLHLESAHAAFYFSKGQLIQRLVHQFKYKGRKDIACLLGELAGAPIRNLTPYRNIDLILPLPMHDSKIKIRGYNQAALIAEGLSKTLNIPWSGELLFRNRKTSTQTNKHRMERWQNADGSFAIRQPDLLRNKHILLVDDVLTTGATLEACGQALMFIPGLKLSILSLAMA